MGRASRRKQQRRTGTARAVSVRPARAVSSVPATRKAQGPLTPAWSISDLSAPLTGCAGDTIPMWAAIMSGISMGQPANSCAYASYQLAGALAHLGYEAEPVAACVNVRCQRQRTRRRRTATSSSTDYGTTSQLGVVTGCLLQLRILANGEIHQASKRRCPHDDVAVGGAVALDPWRVLPHADIGRQAIETGR
jgi:hypothetical protein